MKERIAGQRGGKESHPRMNQGYNPGRMNERQERGSKKTSGIVGSDGIKNQKACDGEEMDKRDTMEGESKSDVVWCVARGPKAGLWACQSSQSVFL